MSRLCSPFVSAICGVCDLSQVLRVGIFWLGSIEVRSLLLCILRLLRLKVLVHQAGWV